MCENTQTIKSDSGVSKSLWRRIPIRWIAAALLLLAVIGYLSVTAAIGSIEYSKGDFTMAIEMWEKNPLMKKKTSQAYLERGRELLQEGKFPEAINDLETAGEIAQEDLVLAHMAYGDHCVATGEYVLAISEYKIAGAVASNKLDEAYLDYFRLLMGESLYDDASALMRSSQVSAQEIMKQLLMDELLELYRSNNTRSLVKANEIQKSFPQLLEDDQWAGEFYLAVAEHYFSKQSYSDSIEMLDKIPDQTVPRVIELRGLCNYEMGIYYFKTTVMQTGTEIDQEKIGRIRAFLQKSGEYGDSKRMLALLDYIEQNKATEAIQLILEMQEDSPLNLTWKNVIIRLDNALSPTMSIEDRLAYEWLVHPYVGRTLTYGSINQEMRSVSAVATLTGIPKMQTASSLEDIILKCKGPGSGKVLIVRNQDPKDSEEEMSCAIDLALMRLLPEELLPQSLDQVSYIVVIEGDGETKGVYGLYSWGAHMVGAVVEKQRVLIYKVGRTYPIGQTTWQKGGDPPASILRGADNGKGYITGGVPTIGKQLYDLMKQCIPGIS